MRIVIGNQYYSTLEGSTIQVQRSATDPVPTCTLHLRDNSSSLNPLPMQELLVIDDQQIPHPTANLALNPSLNPYTTDWTSFSGSGLTLSQNTGGGLIYTFSNCTLLPGSITTQQTPTGSVTPGQSYIFSVNVQGGSSPTNIGAGIFLVWLDAAGNAISTITTTGSLPASTSLVQLTASGVAPAGAAAASLQLGFQRSSTTNSGTLTWTQVQFEPEWFPTQTYPSTWCGPSQANCVQLPLGYWIRQYRRFAGFITHSIAQDYHGNVRTLQIDAVGYAWLTGTILANDSFSNQADSAIITSLANKYLVSAGTSMLSTSNVVTGVTVPSLQANWDDLRTLFDGLAGISGFYWTIDYYWSMIYAPPGYFSQGIGLICDDSSQPNNTTTFPAYNFSAEADFTQPGSTILVIGSGSNVAEVVDPGQTAQLGQLSSYYLPVGTSWMRKINDSTLGSVSTCTQRALAEMLQYDFARNIYHITTNVELIPGESIQLTSATENLSDSTQLVQQTTGKWIGTTELLVDEWEYQSDLGATNRAATNMISRIFRQTQRNSSAPAISTTTLAVLEAIGLQDSVATAAQTSSYVGTVQADGPIGYYRLSNQQGTVADDWSGNGNTGTIVNSPTLNVATLLTDTAPADTSDLAITCAAASSQQINLPTSMVPIGAHAWSLECWFKVTAVPPSGSHQTLMGWGAATGNQKFGVLNFTSNGTTFQVVCSTNSGDIASGNLSTSTIYHVVGTYDGSSTRLYLNGSLVAGPTAFTLSLTQTLCCIAAYSPGSYSSSFFSGTIDEVAFYTYALSSTQISTHYTAGT